MKRTRHLQIIKGENLLIHFRDIKWNRNQRVYASHTRKGTDSRQTLVETDLSEEPSASVIMEE